MSIITSFKTFNFNMSKNVYFSKEQLSTVLGADSLVVHPHNKYCTFLFLNLLLCEIILKYFNWFDSL